ncbi:hypothetical protein [Rahnella aquatilis]|uniref:hypothetical protein n=1 Tax=Rahnella aquatilis TaxID=34038 RepID=UPI00366257A2
MAFRADESAKNGYERALMKLISRDFSADEKEEAKDLIDEIIEEHGPVIDSYPTWHPFVSHAQGNTYPVSTPNRDSGYKGLDHSIFFMNAFITCPYGDGKEIIDSVNEIPYHPAARIEAVRLDIKLYNHQTTPILVTCRWEKRQNEDGSISKALAVPLLLENEVPHWKTAQVAESWETMRPYFLGRPCGSRSSLFINQETGQAMKTIWNAIINTGMFGRIRQ